MKTITFTYTKANGDVSDRTLLVLSEPKEATDKYAGIDISQLDPSEGAKFVSEYERMYDEYQANLKVVMAKFDVKHNYRQFIETGMSDVIEI